MIRWHAEATLKRKTLTLLVAVLAALTLAAQDKKETATKAPAKSAILHPEMTVENGTFEKPMATIGSKPAEAWTTTSVAAGAESKAPTGGAVLRVGGIVDFFCC